MGELLVPAKHETFEAGLQQLLTGGDSSMMLGDAFLEGRPQARELSGTGMCERQCRKHEQCRNYACRFWHTMILGECAPPRKRVL